MRVRSSTESKVFARPPSESDCTSSRLRDAFVSSVLGAVDARDLGPAVALSDSVDRDKLALREDLRALVGVHLQLQRLEITARDRLTAALLTQRRLRRGQRRLRVVQRHLIVGRIDLQQHFAGAHPLARDEAG